MTHFRIIAVKIQLRAGKRGMNDIIEVPPATSLQDANLRKWCFAGSRKRKNNFENFYRVFDCS